MSQSRARSEARREARRAKDDGTGQRPSDNPIAIVRRVLDSVVGVDPNGDSVNVDLSIDQLLAAGQLAAKLVEQQLAETRDGLAIAALALQHDTTPNTSTSTGAEDSDHAGSTTA